MVAQYPLFEFWLLIPKIIEIIIFIIFGAKMYLRKGYALKQLFSFALLTWGVYIIIDSIVWITAANSLNAYRVVGVLRDISLFLAILMSFLIFLTAKVIENGIQIIKSKLIIITGIVFLIFTILLNMNDQLVVINQNGVILPPEAFPPTEKVQVVYQITAWTITSSLVPIGVYLYAIVILVKIAKKTTDPIAKKRMWAMIIGIAMIPLGMVYFIMIGLFGNIEIVTASIGHFIWIMAAIFIWISQSDHDHELKKSQSA
jgi:hypothetical protein